ncbi:hypothetical protein NY08_1723 [Rhodococcus sp. B7740]|nr:hypothetical protein NY08_1723 [Rhodococcus sp. B7740]
MDTFACGGLDGHGWAPRGSNRAGFLRRCRRSALRISHHAYPR